MTRWIGLLLGCVIAISLGVVPYQYWRHRQVQARNFHVVEDGVLYRSGQLSINGIDELIHDYNIRTVVTFRYADEENALPPDWKEEEHCKNRGLNYVRIRPKSWQSEEKNQAPATASVKAFLEVMDNPKNYPVLVHCLAGKHRTGAYCAIYRMEYSRWASDDAIQEMKEHGYTNIEKETDVYGFLRTYVPRWKQQETAARAE